MATASMQQAYAKTAKLPLPLPLRLRPHRRWTLRRSQAQGFNIPALASPAHFG
jgi:hypothetical protein